MSILSNWRANRKIANRDRSLRKESSVDEAKADLRHGTTMTLSGIAGLCFALGLPIVQAHPLLQIGCGIAAVGVGLRYAAFLDLYANERLEEGRSNRLVTITERTLRNTPFRYFTNIKLETLRVRKNHLNYLNDLYAQKEREPENAESIDADITSFNKISQFINPFGNLKMAGLVGLGAGVAATRSIVDIASLFGSSPAVSVASRAIGITFSVVYAGGQLGVFTTKRKAAGDNGLNMHPVHKYLLGKGHDLIMRTPIRYVSWWLLKREVKKLQDLTISPQLETFLNQQGISQQLQVLRQAVTKPNQMRNFQVSTNSCTP